jgi:hypothetical protein
VKYIVFSGADPASKISGGKIRVEQFDSKGKIEEHLTKSGLDYAVVKYPLYFQQFPACAPKKTAEGKYAFRLPMGSGRFHSISTEDAGPIVALMFDQCQTFKGTSLGMASHYETMDWYCQHMSAALKKQITYDPISLAEYEKEHHGKAGEPDHGRMLAFLGAYSDKLSYDVSKTKSLNPNLMPFQQWVEKHAHEFKL